MRALDGYVKEFTSQHIGGAIEAAWKWKRDLISCLHSCNRIRRLLLNIDC